MQDISDERAYFARRERAERTLAMASDHECARAVHLQLATLYSVKCASLAIADEDMANNLSPNALYARQPDQIQSIRARN